MSEKTYLSCEDQFKEGLNQEEISRIENTEVRKIRKKYWLIQKEAFFDVHNISDTELNKISEKLFLAEEKELEPYKKELLK